MSIVNSTSSIATPLAAWQRLRLGNERFYQPTSGHRDGLIAERPTAAIFRCSDGGIAGETVFGQSSGSLIDVSTWGHVIDTGVLATLDYAVGVREVPLIVVLGHHDCHAMHTALRAWKEADLPRDATRATVEQVMASIVSRGVKTDSVESVSAAHIVETGLSLLERSPIIARRVEAGQCAIVCAATESAGGRIRIYGTVGAVGEINESLLECV